MKKIQNSKYKNTEIGNIPQDWEVKKLGDIAKISSGGTPSRIQSDYWNGNIPWVTTTLIDFNTITNAEEFITEKGLQNSATKYFNSGTLLMAMYGQGKTRAKVAILGIDATINQACAAIVLDKKNVENFFVFSYLSSKYDEIRNLSNQGSQENLNGYIIKNILLSFPPLPEQQAIAQVLTDTDNLISALEKLIQKKQNIKKGTLQKFFNGKLLIVNGELKKVKLGDLLDYEQPTNYLVKDIEYDDFNQIPVLTAGKSFILGYTNEDFGIYTNLPVIIFDDFMTTSKYVKFPFKVKSSAIKLLKTKNKNVNLRYVFEYMQQIDFQVGDHKRHWISEFSNLQLTIHNSQLQEEIAEILTDIDNEIEKLETKLEKYRQIKQGFMQELLTGKTRLVE